MHTQTRTQKHRHPHTHKPKDTYTYTNTHRHTLTHKYHHKDTHKLCMWKYAAVLLTVGIMRWQIAFCNERYINKDSLNHQKWFPRTVVAFKINDDASVSDNTSNSNIPEPRSRAKSSHVKTNTLHAWLLWHLRACFVYLGSVPKEKKTSLLRRHGTLLFFTYCYSDR